MTSKLVRRSRQEANLAAVKQAEAEHRHARLCEQYRELERERDEARAEVERCHDSLRCADRAMRAHAYGVAERQREACAAACERVLEEAERHALVPGRVKTGIGAASECVDATRATPLVTEVDK